MDWPYKDPAFDDHDLDIFEYDPRPSLVVRRLIDDKKPVEWRLQHDREWIDWIEEDHFNLVDGMKPGLGVILASRAKENCHNGSILEFLPFTQDNFERIATVLPIHGGIARVINRSDAPIFAEMNLEDPGADEIFYFYRTPSTWPGDMAAALTFHRRTGFTTSVIFGCDKEISESIACRLENSEDASVHPLLVVGMLAEIERERHLELIESRVLQLLSRVYAMSNNEKISETSELHRENFSVDSWIKVTQLRTALETWKVQLLKMIAHIDELERHITMPRTHQTELKLDDLGEIHWRPSFIQTGRRIKKRLFEIVCEYDIKIRDCTMVIDGVTLATQLSWNQIGYQDAQANLRISSDTRQDSGQMRSIAVLTMIFLPATFVSSLFSMSFFNWSPSDGEQIISPYTWIYPVVTVVITIVVILLWYRFIRKRTEERREKSPV